MIIEEIDLVPPLQTLTWDTEDFKLKPLPCLLAYIH
jgi:hypothetical protein